MPVIGGLRCDVFEKDGYIFKDYIMTNTEDVEAFIQSKIYNL